MRVRRPVSGEVPAPATGGGSAAGTRALPRTLVGGIGYRFQRDGSFGLAVADALEALEWPEEVRVADLGYGAHIVADDLATATPPWERLILVAAIPRGREPGGLHRHAWSPGAATPEEVHARMRESGGGVIDLDHLLVIGEHFGALPPDVVLYELEPMDLDGGEGLSPEVAARLDEALERIREDALHPHGG